MATRLSAAHDFAAMVKGVPGWKVTKPRGINGGYLIQAPDGFQLPLHLSSSDVNALRVVKRALDDHGFEADLKRHQERQEQERLARIEADRRQAEEKAAKLSRNADLTARAAGPYAPPEHVPLEWYITDHPAPWSRWVIMTPDVAKYILDNLNTDNRPWKRATVDHYKKILHSGHWRRTHQGGAIDTRKVLQDGQHRLLAIAESGIPVPMLFSVGMEPENFKAIDEGLNRTIGDLLGKDGEASTRNLGSMVRLILAFKEPNPRAFLREKTPNDVLYDAFRGEPERLRTSLSKGHVNSKRIKVTPTALGAAYYLLYEKCGDDNTYLDAFFRGLITGHKPSRLVLDERDPRIAFRNYIANARDRKKRIDGLDQLSMIIRTWNYVVTDHRPRNLRWHEGDAIPTITIYRDRGPGASAVPPLLVGEIELANASAA